ncbi:MAG: DUF1360 domain-containing protein [Solirubrobacterales bacterium]|nr:DUF1360 domain-containing protein [Solirubrobacterales bacterium]
MSSASGQQRRRKPLGGYAVLTLTFNASVAALALAQARSRRSLPERIPAGDIVLLGLGTFKLSRLITKDKVTSFVRSPFTREQPKPEGELDEAPTGRGVRYAIGELLLCPYCISQWIGTGLLAAYLYNARATRTAASVLAVVTVSDYMQQAWVAVDKAA